MFRHHHCGAHRERHARDMREGGYWGEGGPGRGEAFGPGRGRFGGGRRGKLFDGSALKLVLLDLIAEKDSHGYELIKEIEERLGGAYSPSPGVIYPTLSMLEDLGHIAAQAEGARKLFAITEQGRAQLAQNAEDLARVKAKMEAIRSADGAGPPPQIVRAMQNLHMALRMRLSRPLSPERLQAIAATLDAAAQDVERE